MALPTLKQLCTPALVYLAISTIALVVMALQNIGNSTTYCIGMFTCNVASTLLLFAMKVVYVLFWTWVLHLICQAGYKNLSWFLVLFPFILLFILLAMVMVRA